MGRKRKQTVCPVCGGTAVRYREVDTPTGVVFEVLEDCTEGCGYSFESAGGETSELIGFVRLDRDWEIDDRKRLHEQAKRHGLREEVIEETRKMWADPLFRDLVEIGRKNRGTPAFDRLWEALRTWMAQNGSRFPHNTGAFAVNEERIHANHRG